MPLACEEIFNRISANDNSNHKFEVSVSMVEIYNEKVQDLFCNPKQRPKEGLKIRQSKMLGVYVDGINKKPVNSYSEIESWMTKGYKNRSIGATLMNATSS